jgi:hypothetical protein
VSYIPWQPPTLGAALDPLRPLIYLGAGFLTVLMWSGLSMNRFCLVSSMVSGHAKATLTALGEATCW